MLAAQEVALCRASSRYPRVTLSGVVLKQAGAYGKQAVASSSRLVKRERRLRATLLGEGILRRASRDASRRGWRVLTPETANQVDGCPTASERMGSVRVFRSVNEVIALTASGNGDRGPDGRPLVADGLLARLRLATTEEAWSVLRRHGYHLQFEGNWLNPHPDRILVGRAVARRTSRLAAGMARESLPRPAPLLPAGVAPVDEWRDGDVTRRLMKEN